MNDFHARGVRACGLYAGEQRIRKLLDLLAEADARPPEVREVDRGEQERKRLAADHDELARKLVAQEQRAESVLAQVNELTATLEKERTVSRGEIRKDTLRILITATPDMVKQMDDELFKLLDNMGFVKERLHTQSQLKMAMHFGFSELALYRSLCTPPQHWRSDLYKIKFVE